MRVHAPSLTPLHIAVTVYAIMHSMDTKKEYSIYWAHIPGKHTDIMSEGYVGVTIDLERRIREHRTKAKSSTIFYSALQKYKHSIIFVEIDKFDDINLAYIIENNYRPLPDTGWNTCSGGLGGSGYKHSKKDKKKMSISHKGIKHTEEHKRKIGEAMKGKKLTAETKRKMSEAKVGKKHHLYGCSSYYKHKK